MLTGFSKLLIADTRRAAEWMAALESAGIDARRVEALGADAEKAEWQILVSTGQVSRARKLVSDVVAGRKSLPRQLLLGRSAWVAIGAILAVIAGLLLLGGWPVFCG